MNISPASYNPAISTTTLKGKPNNFARIDNQISGKSELAGYSYVQHLVTFTGNNFKANNQTDAFSHELHLAESQKILDGFKTAGNVGVGFFRGKVVDNAKLAAEIIVIDKARDPILRNTIEEYKGEIENWRKKYTFPLEKEEIAYLTSKYVAEKFDKEFPAKAIEITSSFPKEEILLGDIIKGGVGVCRHRALLFKVLFDEIGIGSALYFRRYGKSDEQNNPGYHAWNVISIDNKRILIDAMNNEFIKVDLSKPDKKLALYKDMSGTPIFAPKDVKRIIKSILNINPGDGVSIGMLSGNDQLTPDSYKDGFQPLFKVSWTKENNFILESLSDKKIKVGEKMLEKGENVSLKAQDIIDVDGKFFEFDPELNYENLRNIIEGIVETKKLLREENPNTITNLDLFQRGFSRESVDTFFSQEFQESLKTKMKLTA